MRVMEAIAAGLEPLDLLGYMGEETSDSEVPVEIYTKRGTGASIGT